MKPVIRVLDEVVEGLLIIVLLFFLLYSRKDLASGVRLERSGLPGLSPSP
ncbi:MAG TPA: hypothetical protein VNE63_22260 [Candidatus Acidoferrales bacterium]|nr:hypothetical protein [Candidatus Acidoferrales bacterium]